MKKWSVIVLVVLVLDGCAKYPQQATYQVTREPGVFGYFLKEYRFNLPEVALVDGSTHEWCFKRLAFNAGSPHFHVVLSAEKEIDPRASGISGSVDVRKEDEEYHEIASGPFGDPINSTNIKGKWCSQSYHYAEKPKLRSMSYESCDNLHIEISRWGSYCMRLNIAHVDPTMSGVMGHIVLSSSWK